MKQKLLSIALLAFFLPGLAVAKGRRPPAPVQTRAEKHNDRLLQLINVNMVLTDEQKKVITAAIDNQNRKSEELQRQFDDQQKSLSAETDQAINAVLNDEQKVTYARAKEALQNEEEKKARRRERILEAADHPHPSGGGPDSEERGRR